MLARPAAPVHRWGMTADITLHGPGDVVAILPYQLGYHPHDSVVVVCLRGKRVGLVARTDLPLDEHVDEVVAMLMGPLARDGATSVIVVGYESDPEVSQPLLVALVEQLERAGICVVDVTVVRDGRRYSPTCAEPCCPPEGVALPDPADVPGVAEYVALGRSPLRSRGAVEDLVAPEPWRCLGVARAVESRSRMPRARRRSAAAWSQVLAVGEKGRRAPDRRVVADLALGLADIAWRDGLIAWLAPSVLPTEALDSKVMKLLTSAMPTWGGMGPGARPRALRLVQGTEPVAGESSPTERDRRAAVTERDRRAAGTERDRRAAGTERDALAARTGRPAPAEGVGRAERDALSIERDELLHRLLALCRSLPDECAAEAAAVCTVAAHVAWIGGDGAIARVAVDRAVRLAPDYRLARLLERLVDQGVRLPPVSGAGRGPGALDQVG